MARRRGGGGGGGGKGWWLLAAFGAYYVMTRAPSTVVPGSTSSATVWISDPNLTDASGTRGDGTFFVGNTPPGPMPPWREASQVEIQNIGGPVITPPSAMAAHLAAYLGWGAGSRGALAYTPQPSGTWFSVDAVALPFPGRTVATEPVIPATVPVLPSAMRTLPAMQPMGTERNAAAAQWDDDAEQAASGLYR